MTKLTTVKFEWTFNFHFQKGKKFELGIVTKK